MGFHLIVSTVNERLYEASSCISNPPPPPIESWSNATCSVKTDCPAYFDCYNKDADKGRGALYVQERTSQRSER